MKPLLLTGETSVAEALEDHPEIRGVLDSRGTACAGCQFARFCTLMEVSAVYQLPWDTLIRDVRNAISESQSNGGINA